MSKHPQSKKTAPETQRFHKCKQSLKFNEDTSDSHSRLSQVILFNLEDL